MRHRLLTLLMFAVCGYMAHAQQVLFQRLTWQEAKDKARAEGKGIFVDVYTTWCAPCKKMAKQVFTQPKVGDYINNNFVALSLDAEKEAAHGFFKLYKASAYPTYFWLDADGNLYDTQSGFYPADEFISVSEQALRSKFSRQYVADRAKWERGERSLDFVRHFLFDVVAKVYPDSVRPYLNKYLGGLTEQEIATKGVGELLQWFTYTIRDDSVWLALAKHNDIYQKLLGNDFGKKMYMNLVRVPMINSTEDVVEFNRGQAIVEETDFPNKKMYSDILTMERTLRQKAYAPALKRALAIGLAHEGHFPNVYSEMIYSFILADFFVDTHKRTAEEVADMRQLADRAFRMAPSQCTLLYKAAARALGNDYQAAYRLLANLPFYGEPALSSAVYAKLNLRRIHIDEK